MQLTTINKIISYLLVGSLATALLLVLHFENINNFFTKEENSELLKSIGVLIPLIFLAVAAFLGCVIEGIRDAFIHTSLSKLISSKNCKAICTLKILRLSTDVDNYNFYLDMFKDELKKQEERYQDVLKSGKEQPLRSFACSFFFENVNTDTLNWASSHYATYVLASGLLTLTAFAGSVYFIYYIKSIIHHWQYVLFWLVALYSLARLSISMNLYTWEVTCRQVYIILKDSAQSSDEKVIVDA